MKFAHTLNKINELAPQQKYPAYKFPWRVHILLFCKYISILVSLLPLHSNCFLTLNLWELKIGGRERDRKGMPIMARVNLMCVFGILGFICFKWVDCIQGFNVSAVYEEKSLGGIYLDELYDEKKYGWSNSYGPLIVGQTLIGGAAAKGAVCLDGSLPAYHIDRGRGPGANSWIIQLEGGGWCDTIRNCVYRKKTRHGSSLYMEKQIPFTGILSNKPSENPDFYNWNRVKIRYCDGASFTGDSVNKGAGLYFRGQRIYEVAMEELMSKGMHYANQALLSGCSAGALASILHCDEFRSLFPRTTRVKCLSDGGLFLDAVDVGGGRTMRRLFGGVVRLQGVGPHLPWSCTRHLNPLLCFFPQNLIANIRTPLFLLNAAYDSWQIQASLAPSSADPHGYWHDCKLNYARCNAHQIYSLQDFRAQMLNSVGQFARSRQNGLFINSCFAHCQSERQDTWYSHNSPHVGNKGIAESVGNWYFDRSEVKLIDCPYPCDKSCHNLVFRI